MIAAGAIVRDGVVVAPGTVVGMGAVITKPTVAGGIYLAGVNNLQDLNVVAPRAAHGESP